MTDSTMKQVEAEGEGKMFLLDETSRTYVVQLSGSWHEMGRQYGVFCKRTKATDQLNATLVAEMKKKLPKDTIEIDFCQSKFDAASLRYRQLMTGVAAGLECPLLDALTADMSGAMGIYQGKLHAFAGCTTLTAWGEATGAGTVTGRNMDWSDLFCEFPLWYTVFNPMDGSNSFGSLSWPGWVTPYTAVNDKGLYFDLHDGTSMGGAVVSTDRCFVGSLLMDIMAECCSAKAMFTRFSSTKTDIPTIYSVADKSGASFSLECALFDSRRRLPDAGDNHLSVANTFFNPDWGLHARDTVSHSIARHKNMNDRARENYGKIDAKKMMELFDLRLLNKDGTFVANGGCTKPENLDVDLTNYTFVCDINNGRCYFKIQAGPTPTGWFEVDNNAMFTSSKK